MKLYKNKKGQKLYPVCSFEANQHKLYNAHDRAMNAVYDGSGSWEEVEKIDNAIYAFDSCVQGDLVYANWEDSKLIKNYIYGYDARH